MGTAILFTSQGVGDFLDSGILALDFATAGSFVQVFAADRADPLAKLSAERFEGKGKVDLVEKCTLKPGLRNRIVHEAVPI